MFVNNSKIAINQLPEDTYTVTFLQWVNPIHTTTAANDVCLLTIMFHSNIKRMKMLYFPFLFQSSMIYLLNIV